MNRALILIAFLTLASGIQAASPTLATLIQSERSEQTLTNAEIISLKRRGVSDKDIIERISRVNTKFDIRCSELKRLKAKKISRAVIAEMIQVNQRSAATVVGQEASSGGIVAPNRTAGSDKSKPDKLTSDQLNAQDEATKRANPSVPLQSDAKDSVSPPSSPSAEPVKDPQTGVSDPMAQCYRKQKKKKELPRK